MIRFKAFLAVILLLLPAMSAAQPPKRPLERAMEAMRDGNWAAAQIEARGDGQEALDVILWHYLRSGLGSVREVQAFLTRNPDWPGLPYLRAKSEGAMVAAPSEEILAFYETNVPETGAGALSLARAQLVAGKSDAAEATVIRAWKTLSLVDEERAAFLASFDDILADYHTERLDAMLWNGWTRNAQAMLPLVSEGWHTLAKARIALRADAPGVDALIEAVPEALKEDPGLAFERFGWRMRKGRIEDAVRLLRDRSRSSDTLGRPEAWAGQRALLVRRIMRAGEHRVAYDLAANHHLENGSRFADLEWLAGYLSLRFLEEPQRAVSHFEAFRGAVETPISLGRAGYWLGRAHEAAGNDDEATRAYAFGGQYQTTFYGLLAAERGGIAPDPHLSGKEAFDDWRDADFTQSSVFKAAILLLDAEEPALAERFLTHLAESLDRREIGQMGRMLAELELPHIQVMLGKRAAQYGHEVHAPYYPLHPVADTQLPVPPELVLAIARRESEFDPRVISPVGARGLMQVMPGTAQEVAGWLQVEYSEPKLIADPAYNAVLGSAYLERLARQFGGNAVMIAAGYNAGPSRPERWMNERGDPRGDPAAIVDWIEHIPFTETRNYVMRVTESLPVYRARLGKPPHPVPFSEELAGSTLLPRAPEGE
ncbi:lytic transglycosylase domain-containing protein [Marivita sp. GX14005]|uniref:lytic transglycosylase domain-containing protein n=1 Tax=Marivita sp. GX14005 TaxID=2942276 RepID=UPI00201A21BE|nr:lytic transglycosylase domain-containing protein [Marivita sp. GX14005]MCL3881391.1 lytic transglycosylase domain-containing protein [Marivita sp. GX14005]